jgi:hypothetical protein
MAKVFKTRSLVDVDWTKTPRIEGKVKEAPKEVPELENRKVMVVEGEQGIFRVYESYDLKEAFSLAEEGDSISIEFLEEISLGKGGRTLKKFNAQVWTEK